MFDPESSSPHDPAEPRPRHRKAGWWAVGIAALTVATVLVATAFVGGGWFGSPSVASPGSATEASPGSETDTSPGSTSETPTPETSASDSSPEAESALPAAPGLLAAGSYVAQDQQQADECDGLAAVPPKDLRLLDPRATVTAAAICAETYADLPGEGRWKVREIRDVPTADIPALVAGLTVTDVEPGDGACTAMLMILPGFVLTLSDNTRIRPGVPGNGCHPDDNAVSALGAASTGPVRTTVRIAQVATEQQVRTGCGAEANSPAVWLEAGSPSPSTSPVLPLAASTEVSVCLYSAGDDPTFGPLAATGTVSASAVNAALSNLAGTAPAGCPASPTSEASPGTDWIMIQSVPPLGGEQSSTLPLVLVEISGCQRVVGGSGMTSLGYVSPSAGAALKALADQPAT